VRELIWLFGADLFGYLARFFGFVEKVPAAMCHENTD
jgi:hypothetical protein